MKTTSRHISFEKLADLAENRLADEERAASLSHVADCSHCGARLNDLAQLINIMRTDSAEDAPRDVRANAVALFGVRGSSTKPGMAQRLIAALSFDSAGLSPAHGLRSGQPQARQLLYSAGENDLDLRIRPGGAEWFVSGQVLGQCEGGQVELQGEAGASAVVVPLNDLCEFALPPVPTGRYTLRLRLTDMEVEVPDLELRA
jgi:anti-sigma factor RsiW